MPTPLFQYWINLPFRVPDSRFFTTLYPKPVILTCGTSFTLPVTFRPLEKVCKLTIGSVYQRDGQGRRRGDGGEGASHMDISAIELKSLPFLGSVRGQD
jgi:hypothetical protein